MYVNPVRGEVEASIGSMNLVLVMDMRALARISTATGNPTWVELYRRIVGVDPATVIAVIENCTKRGEIDGREIPKPDAIAQAISRLYVDDMMAMQGPLQGLLGALIRPAKDDEDNPQGNADSGRSGSTPSSAAGLKMPPDASAGRPESSGDQPSSK